jgi:phosphomannomutase
MRASNGRTNAPDSLLCPSLQSSRRLRFINSCLPALASFNRTDPLLYPYSASIQGLAAYVLATNPSATSQGIVIGHDHRHNSQRFALLTASVFLSRGIRVYLYSGLVHTPMVPFGVTHLGAAVGVMITASHNPKNDNGYKVYRGNGVQIISPHDTGIAKAILDNLEPQIGRWDEAVEGVRGDEWCFDRTDELKGLYHEHVAGMSRSKNTNADTPVRIVYTSMHGVGTPFLLKAFETFDLPMPDLVKEQCEPDPEFPTVPFPNPEEKGALVSQSSDFRPSR